MVSSEVHHILPRQIEPRGGVDLLNPVDLAAMAYQYGVTLALLLFLCLASATMLQVPNCKKANAERKRGIGHTESLLQSLLIHTPVVTPYTASSPHSIVTTRRYLHDTTLSCLFLDSGSDAAALHDSHMTEELSHAAAIC